MDENEIRALRKAAVWSGIAGLSHLVAPTFGPGFYPTWYFALTAVGYVLILPAIASLHVRHRQPRASGAVLATIAGVAVVVFGYGASALPPLAPAAAFAIGVWWWTMGKMWAETAVLPRAFGWLTMAGAVAFFISLALYAATAVQVAVADIPMRWMIGLWLVALALVLWTDRGGRV
jgi:hypothetical protein